MNKIVKIIILRYIKEDGQDEIYINKIALALLEVESVFIL